MAILLFLNLKGGVAKTTNAVAVAEAFAEEGKKVLVIDADHQCTASEMLLGRKRLAECEKRGQTLHDLLARKVHGQGSTINIDKYVQANASNIRKGLDTLAVLPCSPRIEDFSTNRAKAQQGWRSIEEWNSVLRQSDQSFKRWLCENYDHAIVDCPPSIALQVRIFLRIGDSFVVPTVPDKLSVRGSLTLMDRLVKQGFTIPALGTLWSLFRSNNTIHAKCIQRSRTTKVLPRPFNTVIPNSTDVARACEEDGVPASLSAKYGSHVAGLFRDLTKEIVGRLDTLYELEPA
jgi:chromosome partitioning protein